MILITILRDSSPLLCPEFMFPRDIASNTWVQITFTISKILLRTKNIDILYFNEKHGFFNPTLPKNNAFQILGKGFYHMESSYLVGFYQRGHLLLMEKRKLTGKKFVTVEGTSIITMILHLFLVWQK